jgi:hypothetical protein
VKSKIVPGGWVLELDDQSWAELMTAVSIAIETCERNDLPTERVRAARLRKMCSELSRG